MSAIWSPNTGIVDYKKVCESYGQDFKSNNGEIILNFEVTELIAESCPSSEDYPIKVISKNGVGILVTDEEFR